MDLTDLAGYLVNGEILITTTVVSLSLGPVGGLEGVNLGHFGVGMSPWDPLAYTSDSSAEY